MTILHEIQKWSVDLPNWQQDAIVRLFEQGGLSINDHDDLCAILKSDNGIPDPKSRIARKFESSQFSLVESANSTIKINSIKDLKNVNAIAENKSLTFGINGLTVIYGDNGSGKSGYSRVLKKACRARDQKEEILPNARVEKSKSGKAEATFEITINDQKKVLPWKDGTQSPTDLASIAIFDSRCARAYLDEEDDFSYVPYGFDIFQGLAQACQIIKTKIDSEIQQIDLDPASFQELKQSSTEVGRMIMAISDKTDPKYVEKMALFDEVRKIKHETILKSLKETNPKQKASQQRIKAGRLSLISNNIKTAYERINNASIENLRDLLEDFNKTKVLSETESKRFKEESNFLPGTGGEVWQSLFEAARRFSLESHPGKVFPHLGEDSKCPLCQQVLGNAVRTLNVFEDFLQKELEKVLRTKREVALKVYNDINNIDMNVGFDTASQAEIQDIDAILSEEIDAFVKGMLKRKEDVKKACGKDGNWNLVGPEMQTPCDKIDKISSALLRDAALLEAASDVKSREMLESEFKEIDMVRRLSEMKPLIILHINKLITVSKLRKCLNFVKTNSITQKSTELSENVISKGLADALNGEFSALGVDNLKVAIKTSSTKGKTKHKLILELPGISNPTLILSEGEQRAVAIASFLGEMNLSGGTGPIVFDDPVSSLDHRRREKVAARLTIESKKRQVIILTHDTYFLCVLQQNAESMGIEVTTLCLQKKSEGYGVPDPLIPFMGASTSARIGMLKNDHVKCNKASRDGDEPSFQNHAGSIYFYLRLAWERAVEEVLFNNVIARFKESVETQRISGVMVENNDYETIEAAMKKCSKYAHDKPGIANVSFPGPDEILSDIIALDDWRKKTIIRSELVKKDRK